MDLTTELESIAFRVLPDGKYEGIAKCLPKTKFNGEEYQNILTFPCVDLKASFETKADGARMSGTVKLNGKLLSINGGELFSTIQIIPSGEPDERLSSEWDDLIKEITI